MAKKKDRVLLRFENLQRSKARRYLILLGIAKFGTATKLATVIQTMAGDRNVVLNPGWSRKGHLVEIATALGWDGGGGRLPPVVKAPKSCRAVWQPIDPATGKRFVSLDAAPSEPDIDGFYRSAEWLESRARYSALKAAAGACLCCGARRSDGVRLVVDHVKPLRRFWSLRFEPANLQVLCDPCNRGKGSWDETDWRSSDYDPPGDPVTQQLRYSI